VVARNQNGSQIKTAFTNLNDVDRPHLPLPVQVVKDQIFITYDLNLNTTDLVDPEADSDATSAGIIFRNQFSRHFFTTQVPDAPSGSLQPLRMTMVGAADPISADPFRTKDPVMRRMRTVASYFEPFTKAPAVSGALTPGQYQFRGGNEMFGTGFTTALGTTFAWFPNGSSVTPAPYRVYGTRGPLSKLDFVDLTAFDGQTDVAHTFKVWTAPMPAGWTTFDAPGPSQATTGGYNPAEKLASAMAEQVQVVAHTEQDLAVDAPSLYADFRAEYNTVLLTDDQKKVVLNDPFVVGARTSTLAGFGDVTALFTPAASPSRNGGARSSAKWTLADFLTQAQGAVNVIHRPRGPEGLFTVKGFDPTVPVGQGANAWMNGGGPFAFGKTNGSFEALELLRGRDFDGKNPDPWFTEFKLVRRDWFALLNQQAPKTFTKALGLSSAKFSLDTPVGLARTYLKAVPTVESDLSAVQAALASGAAVASTGPFLDVSVGTTGPGGLVAGPNASVSLTVNLYKSDWMPVDEVRVVVNGTVAQTLNPATFTQSSTDARLWSATVNLPMASGKDAWIVVEAGVPLATTGVYAGGTPWNRIMRGIYPIAVTNPIFVDVTGSGYTAPLL